MQSWVISIRLTRISITAGMTQNLRDSGLSNPDSLCMALTLSSICNFFLGRLTNQRTHLNDAAFIKDNEKLPEFKRSAPTPAAGCTRFHKRVSYACIRSCFLSRFRGSSRSPAHSGRTSVPQRQAYRSIGRCWDHMCPCRSRRRYTDRCLRRPKHIYRQDNKC